MSSVLIVLLGIAACLVVAWAAVTMIGKAEIGILDHPEFDLDDDGLPAVEQLHAELDYWGKS